jgi:hypothetical protein
MPDNVGASMSATHPEESDRVPIPGGQYRMGQDDGQDDERPSHLMTVGLRWPSAQCVWNTR